MTAAMLLCLSYPFNASANFLDVNEDTKYANAINLLNVSGVVNGCGDGNFYPDEFVSRAEFITVTAAAFSFSADSEHSFEDIPTGAYYEDSVGMAVNMGIIKGKDEKRFAPNDFVTYQEAVAITVRAYEQTQKVKIPAGNFDSSLKRDDFEDWSKNYFDKAVTYRFIPLDENNISPGNYISRGETAQLISNAMLTMGESKTDDFTVPVKFVQTKMGNVFVKGESIDIGVSAGCHILGWEVRSFYGDVLKKGYVKTSEGKANLNFNDLDFGHYSLNVFAFDKDGFKKDLAQTFFAILEDHDFMQYSCLDSPFGMNTSYYKPWVGWNSITADMIYLMGARNIRDGVGWQVTEKEKGVYTVYQPVTVERFKKYGMTQLFATGFINPLYDNNATPWTKEGIQAFANYVNGIYDVYDGYVKFVDVYNEYWAPNFGDQGGTRGQADSLPINYYNMIKATWDTVKPNHPDSVLGIVIGDSSTYRAWTEELFSYGAMNYGDYLQYHTYTRYPETEIKNDVEFMNELMEKYGNGKKMKIWLTETGGHTASEANGLSMREQANLIVRQNVVSLANGIEKVYVYNFMNDGYVQSNNEDNFGVVYNESSVYGSYVPKESYVAYSVMTRKLSGLNFIETKRADDIYHYVFGNDEKKVNILYSLEDTSVALNTNSEIKVTDMMGASKTYTPYNGKVFLDLSKEVLYVEGDFTLSDEILPMQMYVKNAVIDSETKFEFMPYAELKNVEIKGKVSDTKFDVSDGYVFESPQEKGERTYVIDLETDGNVFARMRSEVQFTDAYDINADVEFKDTDAGADGTMKLSVTNHSDTNLNISGVKYNIAEYEGVFDVSDVIEPLSTQTYNLELPKIVPGRMYDVSLRLVRDGNISHRVDYTGRYHYNRIKKGRLPVGATTVDDKSKALYVEKRAFEVVKTGGVGLDDDNDISAELWLTYDDNNIYIRTEVTDDVQGNSGSDANIWNGDCMQIGISTEKNAVSVQPKIYWEIGFALTDRGKRSWVWANPKGLDAGTAETLMKGIKYNIERNEAEKKTTYEIMLAFDDIAPIRPSKNDNLKMTVVLNEGDESGTRDGWLTWGKGLAEGKAPMKFNLIKVFD